MSLDPLSLCQDGRAPPEVNVGWGEIVDAFMVTVVVVVVDERGDLRFEITRQEIVFQQDAVLEGLVPALDLAAGLRMARRVAIVRQAAIQAASLLTASRAETSSSGPFRRVRLRRQKSRSKRAAARRCRAICRKYPLL